MRNVKMSRISPVHSRFAVRDVSLHLVYINFTHDLAILPCDCVAAIHVDIHNVSRNCLFARLIRKGAAGS